MNRSEAHKILKDNGIEMSLICADHIGDSIVYDYIDKYKDWKVGDKVTLIYTEEELKKQLEKGEWNLFKDLFSKEEFIIESFYNVGALHIKDFDYGLDIEWFKKVDSHDKLISI